MYNIDFTNYALEDLAKLKKSEPKAFKKATKLIEELRTHPEMGTGHPKLLGSNRVGEWSRKITDKHRLIYTIEAVNHCPTTRQQLKSEVLKFGLYDKVFIPNDGESRTY